MDRQDKINRRWEYAADIVLGVLFGTFYIADGRLGLFLGVVTLAMLAYVVTFRRTPEGFRFLGTFGLTAFIVATSYGLLTK